LQMKERALIKQKHLLWRRKSSADQLTCLPLCV